MTSCPAYSVTIMSFKHNRKLSCNVKIITNAGKKIVKEKRLKKRIRKRENVCIKWFELQRNYVADLFLN